MTELINSVIAEDLFSKIQEFANLFPDSLLKTLEGIKSDCGAKLHPVVMKCDM